MKFIKLDYKKFNSIHFIDHLSRNKQQQIKKCSAKEERFVNQLAQFLQLLYNESTVAGVDEPPLHNKLLMCFVYHLRRISIKGDSVTVTV